MAEAGQGKDNGNGGEGSGKDLKKTTLTLTFDLPDKLAHREVYAALAAAAEQADQSKAELGILAIRYGLPKAAAAAKTAYDKKKAYLASRDDALREIEAEAWEGAPNLSDADSSEDGGEGGGDPSPKNDSSDSGQVSGTSGKTDVKPLVLKGPQDAREAGQCAKTGVAFAEKDKIFWSTATRQAFTKAAGEAMLAAGEAVMAAK